MFSSLTTSNIQRRTRARFAVREWRYETDRDAWNDGCCLGIAGWTAAHITAQTAAIGPRIGRTPDMSHPG